MQSEHEDNLEAYCAIKFCIKLGKNAKETYERLKTAYWLTGMSQASVFHWHMGFKDGKETVRDLEGRGVPEHQSWLRKFSIFWIKIM